MTLPDKPAKLKIKWYKFTFSCVRCERVLDVSLAPEFPRAWVVCSVCAKTHDCQFINPTTFMAVDADGESNEQVQG